MVEEVSLRVGIDARSAADGAASFKRSAAEIIRSAEKMGRAVGKAGDGFDTLKNAANDNSQTLAKTAQSLRDVEAAVNNLSRSAGQIRTVGEVVKDLGGAAENASRSLGDKFGKKIRGLADFIIELGVKFGVSAETMSKIVTVVEGITAIFGGLKAIIETIKFGRLIRDFGLLAAIFFTFGPVAVGVASAISGLAVTVAAAAAPFAPFIIAAGLATAGVFAFLKATEDVRGRMRSFKESLAEAKTLLSEANELSGEAAAKKRQEASARLLNAQAIAKERSALVGERIREREEYIKVTYGDLVGDDLLKSVPGKRMLKKSQDEVRDLQALQEEQNAIASGLGDTIARLPKPIGNLTSSEIGQSGGAENTPNSGSGRPNGSAEQFGLAAKLEEERIAAEQLKLSFAALQDSLDPLGAATQAYVADLDLLKAAEEAGLITEARQLELRGKLETATLDARDPVAALRRELEQERQQILMTDDEREISNRLLEIEARLKTAGVNVSDKIKSSLEKELIAIQNLRKGRDEAAESQRKTVDAREKRQKDAEEDMKRRTEAVEDVFGDIRDAAKDSIRDVIKGTESIGDAFQKLADRITDILLDLALEELLGGGTGFSDLFGTVFGGIGSILGGGGAASSAASLSRATAAGAFTTFRPTGGAFGFHEGGVVGLDGRPFRYHTGGVSGLRPDEVPAVLQRGEEVLTAKDPRHRDNGGASGGVVVHNHFPNARNTDEARQAGSEIAAKTAAAAQRGMVRKGIG